MVGEILKRLEAVASAEKAKVLQRFFKMGPGEYGESDRFLGIVVPVTRKLAREYRGLDLEEVEALLGSEWHEARLMALFVLVQQFDKADEKTRAKIYRLYLRNLRFINNWDLVDCSAPYLIGPYLRDKDRSPLHKLARSKRWNERRVAMLATFAFIRRGEFGDALAIAETLLEDPEDLLHKAVGWMLREIGNRDRPTEEAFLRKHYRRMPRTMLRYAIEKFPPSRRQAYLKGRV